MGVLEFKKLVSVFAGVARALDGLCPKIWGEEA